MFVADGSHALCSKEDVDLSQLTPCSQEEADTRMFLHAHDAVRKGCSSVMLRTGDTDVLVIAVGLFYDMGIEELWLAFGTGSSYRYIAAHEIATALMPRKAHALLAFNAVTGCDVTSAFNGRGKKTAWDTWNAYEDVTEAFEELAISTEKISEQSEYILERFTILMYERTSGLDGINGARKELFTKKDRALENIPPAKDALVLHINRARIQTYTWKRALIKDPPQLDPAQFGWQHDGCSWTPVWTTLPQASNSCYELIKCGCKKACQARCKCVCAALKCTALCAWHLTFSFH